MSFNKQQREKIHAKYGGHCAYCGEEITIKQMQVDHVVPQRLRYLDKYDIDHIDNLNPSCRVCNKWKSAHNLELFRSEIESQLQRLNSYSASFRMAKRFGLIKETPRKVVFYFETSINH